MWPMLLVPPPLQLQECSFWQRLLSLRTGKLKKKKSKKKIRRREIKDFLSHLFLNFLVKHRRFFLELSVSTQFWNLGFGFPGWWVVKNQHNKEETGSIPGLGRSPGDGNGNPFQYSCLGNPINRWAWWATVHGAAKSQTRQWLNSSSKV